MKDKSAMGWKEKQQMYKVGSCFKGCAHCGDVEIDVDERTGKKKKRWLTGMSVYRSYHPWRTGFTYYCWDCSAKDEKCWVGAIDIGRDAIVGARDAVRKRKVVLRKEAVKMETKAPSRASEIARLEAELARLMEMLKGRN